MTSLTVIVSPLVHDQVLERAWVIAEHSIANAIEWQDRVRKALDGLGDRLGHAVDEQATRRLGRRTYRLVFERTYLIFYRIDPTASQLGVFFFRHGAREPRAGEP